METTFSTKNPEVSTVKHRQVSEKNKKQIKGLSAGKQIQQ